MSVYLLLFYLFETDVLVTAVFSSFVCPSFASMPGCFGTFGIGPLDLAVRDDRCLLMLSEEPNIQFP